VAAPLTQLQAALGRIAVELEALGVKHALIGGLAVSLRTEPRTTRDVDIAVAVASDNQAEALLIALRARGWQIRALIEQTTTKRLATARLVHEESSRVLVDLLFASSGIEQEVVGAADMLPITPGVTMPVASVAHLIAMKVLSRNDRERPQDLDDLRALRKEAKPADLAAARRAIALIAKRGFGRGRPLAALLDEIVAETPRPAKHKR
jgi:predicted nucleotidyltransferase